MFRPYAAERCPGSGRKGSDRVSRRKAVWGWMLFDWANQPWYTLIVTYVFGPYFVSRVAADPVHGQAVWGYAIAAASVVVALTAPVLGAIADAVGPRKPWVLAFSALYVVGAAGLWGAAPGLADPTAILAFLAIALIGAEYTGVTADPGSGVPAPAAEPGGQATGESLIGRVLDAEQVSAVRTSFGLDGGTAMTGPEAFEAVMDRGNALSLANGWRLARRRLMGGNRVEIEGPADTDLPALRRMGCTAEIVSWRTRVFAPNADAIERILKRWPLAA